MRVDNVERLSADAFGGKLAVKCRAIGSGAPKIVLGVAGAADFGGTAVTAVSYWPAAASGSLVLDRQRDWFRGRAVPPDASYLTNAGLTALLGRPLLDLGPEDLQRRYLDAVTVPESELIPEYVAVAR